MGYGDKMGVGGEGVSLCMVEYLLLAAEPA